MLGTTSMLAPASRHHRHCALAAGTGASFLTGSCAGGIVEVEVALPLSSFLHLARNVLRSAPCNPLASACLEHSIDSGVCTVAVFDFEFAAALAPALIMRSAEAAIIANAFIEAFLLLNRDDLRSTFGEELVLASPSRALINANRHDHGADANRPCHASASRRDHADDATTSCDASHRHRPGDDVATTSRDPGRPNLPFGQGRATWFSPSPPRARPRQCSFRV